MVKIQSVASVKMQLDDDAWELGLLMLYSVKTQETSVGRMQETFIVLNKREAKFRSPVSLFV